MTGMLWGADTDHKILVFLLATNPSIKLDFDGAAKALSEGGRVCSARAVQDRFMKIKQEVMQNEKWSLMAEQASVGHGSHGLTSKKRYRDEENAHAANDKQPKRARKVSNSTQVAPMESTDPAKEKPEE